MAEVIAGFAFGFVVGVVAWRAVVAGALSSFLQHLVTGGYIDLPTLVSAARTYGRGRGSACEK